MPERFRAYRVSNDDGEVSGALTELTLDDLDAGDVVLHTEYSSVNYKDALAATGKGRIMRRFPMVAGIDAAGVVETSSDGRFREGDRVLVTGYGLGEEHDGGYSSSVRVPGDWLVPLPEGMDSATAMAVGTAGFTAAISVVRMEENGLAPDRGPVLVTGATGGVGSIAIDILAARGYEVHALTGKDAEHDYLRGLGAREVISRQELQMGERPLEKALWAGSVDAAGGAVLAWLTRTTMRHGSIASCGLAAGADLTTTVMPFILRGVNLLGIDSGYYPMERRRELWSRLAGDLRPPHLEDVTRTIGLDELPHVFGAFIAGQARGRTVVRVSE